MRDPQEETDVRAGEVDLADTHTVPSRWETRREAELAFRGVELEPKHPMDGARQERSRRPRLIRDRLALGRKDVAPQHFVHVSRCVQPEPSYQASPERRRYRRAARVVERHDRVRGADCPHTPSGVRIGVVQGRSSRRAANAPWRAERGRRELVEKRPLLRFAEELLVQQGDRAARQALDGSAGAEMTADPCATSRIVVGRANGAACAGARRARFGRYCVVLR